MNAFPATDPPAYFCVPLPGTVRAWGCQIFGLWPTLGPRGLGKGKYAHVRRRRPAWSSNTHPRVRCIRCFRYMCHCDAPRVEIVALAISLRSRTAPCNPRAVVFANRASRAWHPSTSANSTIGVSRDMVEGFGGRCWSEDGYIRRATQAGKAKFCSLVSPHALLLQACRWHASRSYDSKWPSRVKST